MIENNETCLNYPGASAFGSVRFRFFRNGERRRALPTSPDPHSLLHPQACCGSIKGRLKRPRTTREGIPEMNKHSYIWKMAIDSGFFHRKWRFSIAIYVKLPEHTRDEETSYEPMSRAPHLHVTSIGWNPAVICSSPQAGQGA